jgi:hypothetical protein
MLANAGPGVGRGFSAASVVGVVLYDFPWSAPTPTGLVQDWSSWAPVLSFRDTTAPNLAALGPPASKPLGGSDRA